MTAMGPPDDEHASAAELGQAADVALSGNASRSIVRGALARGGTYVLSTGLLALAFVFVFRALTPEQFGQLSVVIAFAAIAQQIGDTAVATIAQRLLVAASAEERLKLHAQLVGIRLVVMPPVLAIAVACAALADAAGVSGYSVDVTVAVAVVCGGTLLSAIGAGFVAPLAIELRAARASLTDFARQLATAAGLMTAVAVSASLLGYAAVYLLAAALSLVIALALIEPGWRRIAMPSAATSRLVAREAGWFAVAVTVNSMFLKLLVILTSLRTTEFETGLFGAATRVTEVLAVLPLLMASVAYPLLSRAVIDGDTERFSNAVHRVVEGVLLMMGGAAVVLIVGAEPLLRAFSGEDYLGAAPVLQVQAVALFAAATTQALIWALIAMRAERLLVITNLIGLTALLSLGYVLIGRGGAQGAAEAAVGGELVLLAVTVIALWRVAPHAVPLTGRIVRTLAATAACCAVGLLLPLPPIAATAIAAVLFAGAAIGLKLIPTELLAAARPAAAVAPAQAE